MRPGQSRPHRTHNGVQLNLPRRSDTDHARGSSRCCGGGVLTGIFRIRADADRAAASRFVIVRQPSEMLTKYRF